MPLLGQEESLKYNSTHKADNMTCMLAHANTHMEIHASATKRYHIRQRFDDALYHLDKPICWRNCSNARYKRPSVMFGSVSRAGVGACLRVVHRRYVSTNTCA